MAKKPQDHGAYNAVDSEWEYEYHETETEDLYFTLDLTAHDPDALDEKKLQNLAASMTDFQVLDLHTTEPLIKIGNEVYSCYWSTDLGTQVHVAPAGFVANALRPGSTVDIVATTRARLLAKPVTLVPRRQPLLPVHPGLGQTSENAIIVDPELEPRSATVNVDETASRPSPSNPAPISSSSEPIPQLQSQPQTHSQTQSNPQTNPNLTTPQAPSANQLIIPPELRRTRVQDQQADFLERLSAIKLRKGESDPVPMYLGRSYAKPANWREVRQKAVDAGLSAAPNEGNELTRTEERSGLKRKRGANLVDVSGPGGGDGAGGAVDRVVDPGLGVKQRARGEGMQRERSKDVVEEDQDMNGEGEEDRIENSGKVGDQHEKMDGNRSAGRAQLEAEEDGKDDEENEDEDDGEYDDDDNNGEAEDVDEDGDISEDEDREDQDER